MNTPNVVVASCVSEEAFFSWKSCEYCHNTLGGNRYVIMYKEALNSNVETMDVCTDCMIKLCN